MNALAPMITHGYAQIHFGAAWPLSFAAILRAKVSDARIHRRVALEGHRFTPSEALQAGLVDHIVKGNTEAVVAKAREVAEAVSGLSRTGSLGLIKVIHGLFLDSTHLISCDPV